MGCIGGVGFARVADAIFHVPVNNCLGMTNFQSEMLDLWEEMCKVEAFLGQNDWVAGGRVCFALMADVTFHVPVKN